MSMSYCLPMGECDGYDRVREATCRQTHQEEQSAFRPFCPSSWFSDMFQAKPSRCLFIANDNCTGYLSAQPKTDWNLNCKSALRRPPSSLVVLLRITPTNPQKQLIGILTITVRSGGWITKKAGPFLTLPTLANVLSLLGRLRRSHFFETLRKYNAWAGDPYRIASLERVVAIGCGDGESHLIARDYVNQILGVKLHYQGFFGSHHFGCESPLTDDCAGHPVPVLITRDRDESREVAFTLEV
jgi:hypothetical protein